MGATILVTGATGYLGQALVGDLLERGYSLRVLVRDPSRLAPAHRGRVESFPGDLEDPGRVAAACAGVQAVFHLGGIAADWVRDPSVFERVNVGGTANVLAGVRAHRVPRLLVTSSVMVLGPSDGLEFATERTARPSGGFHLPYQVTKAKATRMAQAARGARTGITILYPGALYGPGPLTEGNYLARVMGQLASGGYPCLPRTDGRRWCFAHVADVAAGHRLAFERAGPDGDYILGGDNAGFETMIELIRDGLALPSTPPRIPGSLLVVGLRVLALVHGFFGTRPPMSVGGGKALGHDWAFSSAAAAAAFGYRWRPFLEAFPEFVRWYATVGRARGAPAGAGP